MADPANIPKPPDIARAAIDMQRSVRQLELERWAGKRARPDKGPVFDDPIAAWLCAFNGATGDWRLGQQASYLLAAEQVEKNLDIHRLIRALRAYVGAAPKMSALGAFEANTMTQNVIRGYMGYSYTGDVGLYPPRPSIFYPSRGGAGIASGSYGPGCQGIVIPSVPLCGLDIDKGDYIEGDRGNWSGSQWLYSMAPRGPGIIRVAGAYADTSQSSGTLPPGAGTAYSRAGYYASDFGFGLSDAWPFGGGYGVGKWIASSRPYWWPVPKNASIGSWTAPYDGFLLGIYGIRDGGGFDQWTSYIRQRFIGTQVYGRPPAGWTGDPPVIGSYSYSRYPVTVNAGPGDWDPTASQDVGGTLLEPIPTGLTMGILTPLGAVELAYMPEHWLRVDGPPPIYYRPRNTISSAGASTGIWNRWTDMDIADGFKVNHEGEGVYRSDFRDQMRDVEFTGVMARYPAVLQMADFAVLADWIERRLYDAQQVGQYDQKFSNVGVVGSRDGLFDLNKNYNFTKMGTNSTPLVERNVNFWRTS